LEVAGRKAWDWIVRYLAEVESYPVLARVSPGEIRAALPEAAPEEPESFDRILSDFERIIVPGLTHWNHPAFHAYFAVTGSGPGIVAEMLTAALNANAMVWRASPAGTELEELVVDWVRALVGLPPSFRGVIQDTASTSSLVALAGARHRALPEVGTSGMAGRPAGRIYASEEAHSSIEKAAILLGLGREGLRRIPTDASLRMRPEALRSAIREDRAAGRVPIAVVATIGTTSTASSDPVGTIAELAAEAGTWLHVDAAYAGPAAMVPSLRPVFRGWEEADSIVLNPHKWLFTPMDCSLLLMRSPEEVRASLSLTPEYLRTREDGEATNLMDYGVALGRRFRALKLWFVLRAFGARGIRERITAHIRMAERLGSAVDAEPGWERLAPVSFSTVVLRFAPPGRSGEALDTLNLELLERVNRSGRAFLSHTRVGGRIGIRVAIGNVRTQPVHLTRLWELLREHAAAAEAGSGPQVPADPN
jgi:aromatic-L-amino-acid/L-tryptophan decarboxylase